MIPYFILGMATSVSRIDLYDQVWAEPMTTVAKNTDCPTAAAKRKEREEQRRVSVNGLVEKMAESETLKSLLEKISFGAATGDEVGRMTEWVRDRITRLEQIYSGIILPLSCCRSEFFLTRII